MTTSLTPARYASVSILLHWLMAALIVAVYACIELREFYPRGSDIRDGLKMWHFMLGLSILLLVFIRIAARLMTPTPAIVPAPPKWQSLMAKATHLFLHVMMIGMPIGGWLILSGEGKAIPFFGLDLPPLVGPDKAFAHSIEELHETIGTIGYFVIALHTAAAIFHHYVVKDNTLRRMLPGA